MRMNSALTIVLNKKPVIPSDSRGICCPALCCSFTTQDPSAALGMTVKRLKQTNLKISVYLRALCSSIF